ncbi:MAG: rhomboid family intramembrane serine protease [Proteobacteria bacterium]|nr:rhomboid family intramembrane serine protease [Pseudomonadota bacterium]MBU1739100.1 rhomboid family intramembrane serine protease [Pseudomonadota bacterium]
MSVAENENTGASAGQLLLLETGSRYRSDVWSLVLLSAGIPHLHRMNDDRFQLEVAEKDYPRAKSEIARFEEENLNWPPPPAYLEATGSVAGHRNPPTALIMGALLVFYTITGPSSHGSEWFKIGAVDSRAMIYGGEWWRALTALTLHSDSVHLAGNLLIGGLVIHYLCRNFGTGFGWFLVIMSGAAGNILNVLARGAGHFSVGFSTAVFGAVGILCGSRASRSRYGWLKGFLLPIGAGCALLAMLGSTGRRTDLGAHLWGLVSGLLLGAAAGLVPVSFTGGQRIYRQSLFFIAAVSLLYFAWQQAVIN